MKIRAEIDEIENRKPVEKIHSTKSWVFEKINRIDKLLTTKKREKTESNEIRKERGDIRIDTREIQRIKSKDVHVLIPSTGDYVSLQGQRELQMIVKDIEMRS